MPTHARTGVLSLRQSRSGAAGSLENQIPNRLGRSLLRGAMHAWYAHEINR